MLKKIISVFCLFFSFHVIAHKSHPYIEIKDSFLKLLFKCYIQCEESLLQVIAQKIESNWPKRAHYIEITSC